MKTVRLNIGVILLLIAAMFAHVTCKKNDNSQVVSASKTFCLDMNDCASIKNKKYSICLTNVQDERPNFSSCHLIFCEDCIASLDMLWIDRNNNDTSSFTLTTFGCSEHKPPTCYESFHCANNFSDRLDTLNYRFCLLQLYPHPETNRQTINENEYLAKFKIQKL